MSKHSKNDREEIACEVFDKIPPKEELEEMSNLSLAKLQESFSADKAGLIIIQNEWRRRERIDQHKLNKKLIFSAGILGAIGAVLGGITGALLTWVLMQGPSQDLQQKQPSRITQSGTISSPLITGTMEANSHNNSGQPAQKGNSTHEQTIKKIQVAPSQEQRETHKIREQ
jgi:hypothetical protein